ncbi:hypothetical protein [Mesorhizobium sp. B2-3-4]|uniref:hypothetical protein n=1 Tax=Mesorhizobium sp. B2-3-4 TaxID=2589959 RepID=UPI0011263811|nr:hypothetical protein [Mesorhizobium sp. B2-3-4]TPM32779.1 hypothetical protein FJ967_22920 [Mesorhizobium sp. B2-3-4]
MSVEGTKLWRDRLIVSSRFGVHKPLKNNHLWMHHSDIWHRSMSPRGMHAVLDLRGKRLAIERVEQ